MKIRGYDNLTAPAGSHEVDGSIPISSTIKNNQPVLVTGCLILRQKNVPAVLTLFLYWYIVFQASLEH